MSEQWGFIMDFMYISVCLAAASILKTKIKVFDKYIIPTSIIAGFIGLLAGPQVLDVFKTQSQNLEGIVYHMLSIGFIAMALKERQKNKTKEVISTGLFIVSTYLFQAIIGFVIAIILMLFLYHELFPGIGLLLPLAYGQGPGFAYSIGSQWEKMGFEYMGNVGLALATLGYIWGSIGGILMLNYLIRKRHFTIKNDLKKRKINHITELSEAGDVPLSQSMDKITIQLAIIGAIYFITYMTISGLNTLLLPLGSFGATIAQILWGFNFLFGIIYAIFFRYLFDFLKKRKVQIELFPNDYLLQRISGGSFDFLVAAAISAISFFAVKEYFVPILLLSFFGGILTMGYSIFICKKVYKKYTLEYTISLYGMMTGTVSTALALLKETDPYFNTRVAENLVLGSAVALFVAFPLLLVLNIPVIGYVRNNSLLYWVTLIILMVYILIILFVMLRKKLISSKE